MTESYRDILCELRDDAAEAMVEAGDLSTIYEMIEGLAQALLILDEKVDALENGTVRITIDG